MLVVGKGADGAATLGAPCAEVGGVEKCDGTAEGEERVGEGEVEVEGRLEDVAWSGREAGDVITAPCDARER